MSSISETLSDLYRVEFSKILAALTRIFGVENIELAEDALQETFCKALLHWQKSGAPENPGGWLMITAKNHAIDVIRANKNKLKFADDLSFFLKSEWSLAYTIEQAFDEQAIKDDQLRMMFWCCQPSIKIDNQIPVILSLLCGFSLTAIARALLLPEQTIKKRLYRAKQQLKQYDFQLPNETQMAESVDTVLAVLYLFFNEGLHCSDGQKTIEIDYCTEAIALLNQLVDVPHIANRETLALYALMHFHMARIDSRVDSVGNAVPLDLQDRTLWNKALIKMGERILNLAGTAIGNDWGRFYCEAKISQAHCTAATFMATDWPLIVSYYQQLIELTQSPLALLNQAIAKTYAGETQQAIVQVKSLLADGQLAASYLPYATLAHIYAKQGEQSQALAFAEQAKAKGGTPKEQQLMMQQIERLLQA